MFQLAFLGHELNFKVDSYDLRMRHRAIEMRYMNCIYGNWKQLN